MNRYIISGKVDILLMSLFPILIFGMLKFSGEDNLITFVAVLLISVILDNGHVYFTYSRIAKEFQKAKVFFVAVPIIIFLTFLTWQYFKIPYFYSFVVYATLFHFIRQAYGINRWYMLSEKGNKLIIDFIMYSLMITPLIALHFRSDLHIALYDYDDFFIYTSNDYLAKIICINLALLATWFIYELVNIKQFNKQRFIFMSSTAILFSFIGYFANNEIEVIIPFMSAHGLQYLLLSAKFENEQHKINFKKILILLVFIGAVFGGLDTYAQGSLEEDMNNIYMFSDDVLSKVLIALLFVPLVSHYIYDMKIWTKKYIQTLK